MRTAVRPRAEMLTAPASQRKLVLGVGLLIAGFLVFFPTKQLVDQRVRIHHLESRQTALQTENERLAEQVERLERPESFELLARERLGLVRPGERVYLFVPPEEAEPAAAPAPADDEPSFVRRWWTAFLDLLRGGG